MIARLSREEWHTHRSNLVLLVSWAADECFTPDQIARIVEKPWKWRAEFVLAYCTAYDANRKGRKNDRS